jgi:hypothetical protein
VVGEVRVSAGGRLAGVAVLGFDIRPVGGEDETRLRGGRGRALPQRGQRLARLARRTDGDVDMFRLQDARRMSAPGSTSAPEQIAQDKVYQKIFKQGRSDSRLTTADLRL